MSRHAIEHEQGVIAYQAQQDLYFFTRYLFWKRHGYFWRQTQHHEMICCTLAQVLTGHIKRLIINILPRYSKTELEVTNFIAWSLGQFPDAAFIYTS